MKPFKLETVLNFRKRLEDIAVNNLAKAKHAEELVNQQIVQEKKRYNTLIHTIEKLQQEGVNILTLINHEDQCNYVKKRIASLHEELKMKKQDVRHAHADLVKKSRERQVMEKLKKRQNDAWKKHLEKQEAVTLDEIAVIFHNR